MGIYTVKSRSNLYVFHSDRHIVSPKCVSAPRCCRDDDSEVILEQKFALLLDIRVLPAENMLLTGSVYPGLTPFPFPNRPTLATLGLQRVGLLSTLTRGSAWTIQWSPTDHQVGVIVNTTQISHYVRVEGSRNACHARGGLTQQHIHGFHNNGHRHERVLEHNALPNLWDSAPRCQHLLEVFVVGCSRTVAVQSNSTFGGVQTGFTTAYFDSQVPALVIGRRETSPTDQLYTASCYHVVTTDPGTPAL